jgi:hypothetical protein
MCGALLLLMSADLWGKISLAEALQIVVNRAPLDTNLHMSSHACTQLGRVNSRQNGMSCYLTIRRCPKVEIVVPNRFSNTRGSSCTPHLMKSVSYTYLSEVPLIFQISWSMSGRTLLKNVLDVHASVNGLLSSNIAIVGTHQA